MPEPEGTLTSVQYQILLVVWDHQESGVTATEIWAEVTDERDVGRTTILKQIQRLEARGWLARLAEPGVSRYVASVDRDEADRMLAGDFVDDFFGGSLSKLVTSLLGTRRIKQSEVEKLRQLLNEHKFRNKLGRKSS